MPGEMMRHFAQELQAMRLWLDRIGFRVFNPADHFNFSGLQLKSLALAFGNGDHARRPQGATGAEFLHFGVVIAQNRGCNDLYRREAGTIADVNERQTGFGITAGSDPALHGNCFAGRQFAAQHLLNACNSHT